MRKGTYSSINLQNLIYLIFYHPDDLCDYYENMEDKISTMEFHNAKKMVMDRINKRGAGHINLFPTPGLLTILNGFIESYEYLDEYEKCQCIKIIYIDMTLKKEEILNCILNELKTLDIIQVPNVNEKLMEKTINEVLKEEELLANKNTKNSKTLYWGAFVQDPNYLVNNKHISTFMNENKEFKLKDEFHCTMLYVNGDNKIKEANVSKWNEKNVQIIITHLVYDDKIAVLKIKCDFPTETSIPHITLALKEGVKPFYANEMLLKDHKEIIFEEQLILKGKVIRQLKFN